MRSSSTRIAGMFAILVGLTVVQVGPARADDTGEKKQKDDKQVEKELGVAQRARVEARKLGKVVSALAGKPGTPKEQVDRALMLLGENDVRATGDVLLLGVVLAHSKAVPGGVDDLQKTIEGVEAAVRALEGQAGKIESMSAQIEKILPALLAEVSSERGAKTLCEKLEAAFEGATTVQAILDRLDSDARSSLLHALGL